MAVPSTQINPILAVNLPLVLDQPPGFDPATEALRLALLGVGAVHQAYLLSRSDWRATGIFGESGGVIGGMSALGLIPRIGGLKTTKFITDQDSLSGPLSSTKLLSLDISQTFPSQLLTQTITPTVPIPKGGGGVQNLSAHARDLLNLAVGLRLAASKKLHQACQSIAGTISDASLGASLTIALIDIFSGGHHWNSNITLAKTLVRLRGGPLALLSAPMPPGATRFGGGLTVHPARLWLEILAVYETFGSLTSGEDPTLLADGANEWWFEAPESTYHRYSVEQVFGMSRSMIALLARVSAFFCRSVREKAMITPTDFSPSELSTPQSTPPSSPPLYPLTAKTAHEQFVEDAKALYKSIQSYIALPTETALPYPSLGERVTSGNETHRLALCILMLRDVFKVPRGDQRVQIFAQRILDICLGNAELDLGVDLTWPVIICGSQVVGPDRQRVLDTFDAYRRQCCFEIDSSEQIVTEVWRRCDARLPRSDWRSVVEDLNLRILVL